MLLIDRDLLPAVVALNDQCSAINRGLFFADSFLPKKTPSGAHDEVQFWYAVTNVYALFFDCAPYIFRKHEQYCRYTYSHQNTKTLLEILLGKRCLLLNEEKEIIDFIFAINEIRSCFCHNKPNASFDRGKIERGLGNNPDWWAFFPHLSNRNECSFNYTIGLKALTKRFDSIIGLFDKAIASIKSNCSEDDLLSWSQSIAAWYFQSDDIINRCLSSYYDIGSKSLRKWQQIRIWKSELNLNSMGKKAKVRVNTLDQYLVKWVQELTDNIYCSHTLARPEIILGDFFDAVL